MVNFTNTIPNHANSPHDSSPTLSSLIKTSSYVYGNKEKPFLVFLRNSYISENPPTSSILFDYFCAVELQNDSEVKSESIFRKVEENNADFSLSPADEGVVLSTLLAEGRISLETCMAKLDSLGSGASKNRTYKTPEWHLALVRLLTASDLLIFALSRSAEAPDSVERILVVFWAYLQNFINLCSAETSPVVMPFLDALIFPGQFEFFSTLYKMQQQQEQQQTQNGIDDIVPQNEREAFIQRMCS